MTSMGISPLIKIVMTRQDNLFGDIVLDEDKKRASHKRGPFIVFAMKILKLD